MLLEVAIGDPRNRNRLMSPQEAYAYLRQNGAVPLYRSVFAYDEEITKFLEDRGSIKNFPGKRYPIDIPIDIDKGSNSDEYTLKKLRDVITKLLSFGLKETSFRAFFSGSGYHVMINKDEFNFKPDEDLPIVVETTMKSLGLVEDPAVLRRTSIIRSAHSINLKTNLFKIPLSLDEALNLSPEEIKGLAKTPRFEFEYPQSTGKGTFIDKVIEIDKQMPEKTLMLNRDATAHLMHYVCIQKLLSMGPVKGIRNNAVLRILSHLKWSGIPEQMALPLMLQWNQMSEESLDDNEIRSKTRYIYTSAVRYGCNDTLLRDFCRPSCVKYEARNIPEGAINPMNVDTLKQKYLDRVKLMKESEKFINLKNIFGLEQDCILYPGELVTFQGDTGMNKTSILQNILIGMNMRTQLIHPHKQNILLYETELGGGGIHERFLSMITNLPRHKLMESPNVVEDASKVISNISIQAGEINLEGLEKIISDYQFDVIVVDYIEKVLHPLFDKGSDTAAISQIMRSLSSMAQKYKVVIIAISQVSRSAVADGRRVELHSGKGSSSIESSSRRVFTINGDSTTPYRTIAQVKANNDILWDGVVIERLDSWRFIRR